MVEHSKAYPWSSYAYSALGKDNALLAPHSEYLRLGKSVEERQKAYGALFKPQISKHTLSDIRGATN